MSRTEYRTLRTTLILECISELQKMLIMKKLELEKIPLPYFKKLKRTIQSRNFE
jgi:hypothetical protein